MGQVYSHLSEEERQVVRIGMGNGAGVRRMATYFADELLESAENKDVALTNR